MAGRPARGFTLIEILVVLTIIGIILATARLSFGTAGSERAAEDEARRFAELLNLVAEQAVLRASEYGVRTEADGYRFYLHKQGEWQPIEDDPLLRPRKLPTNLHGQLSVQGQVAAAGTDRETSAPQILLLSSGEQTQFELRLTSTDGTGVFVVTPSEGGRFAATKILP